MAELLHEFRRHNADISYQPIVGGGANACVLHYRDNDQPLRDGDLLLLDAGCEYDYYASDITRTFPVNGRFTPAQRAVYEIVLEAQLAAIDKVRPGNHWNEPHDAAVRAITRGLVRSGCSRARVPQLIKDGAYRQFFMHRTGHWLGHGRARRRRLQGRRRVAGARARHGADRRAGHLHPGRLAGVPKRFWNIGIRIEDDVAVTARRLRGAHRRACQADPDEIEALMADGVSGLRDDRGRRSTSPSSAAAWSARASRWRWRRRALRIVR